MGFNQKNVAEITKLSNFKPIFKSIFTFIWITNRKPIQKWHNYIKFNQELNAILAKFSKVFLMGFNQKML